MNMNPIDNLQNPRFFLNEDGETARFFYDNEINGETYILTIPKVRINKPTVDITSESMVCGGVSIECNRIATLSFEVLPDDENNLFTIIKKEGDEDMPIKSLYAHDLKISTKNINLKDIDRVVYNNPATIIFWKNGDKTVVKAQDGDTFDEETGLAMALAKYACGNKGYFNEIFKKFLPRKDENKYDI